GLGPAAAGVAAAELDAVVTQRLESLPRLRGQGRVTLDGVHAARDAAHHRGGVPRAGTDLEHALAGGDPGRVDHQGDNVGLRDRLAFTDRQRRILVGELAHARIDEHLARHLAHRVEDVTVADVAPGEVDVD